MKCPGWQLEQLRKECETHIDASHARQSLVKGKRFVRYELNAVKIVMLETTCLH